MDRKKGMLETLGSPEVRYEDTKTLYDPNVDDAIDMEVVTPDGAAAPAVAASFRRASSPWRAAG